MRPSVSGMPNSARTMRVVSSDTSSDFHDFCFFSLQKVVDFRDEVVVQLLQILLGVLHVVFAGVLELLKLIPSLGARVTNRDARFFRQLVHDLHQLLSALLVEHRERHAYHSALSLRVQTEI